LCANQCLEESETFAFLTPSINVATFFPRYYFEDLKNEELASYFEPEPETGITDVPALQAFFQKAAALNIDVAIGYGEQNPSGERYNTASYFCAKSKKAVGKYRKIHLPGTFEPFSKDPDVTNQLEKRYFLPGNLGFKAFRAPGLKVETEGAKSPIIGMLICNDRRWAEGWRVYGLQGVEIMCIGYVREASVHMC
jgi:predicted amidohydrolase